VNRDLHRRVSEVFLRASEVPRAQRERFLDQACAGEPELRREVESLFQQEAREAHVVSPEMILPQVAEMIGEAEHAVPRQVGPFTLLRKLGEGGMAVVFLAEQQHPIRRNVALKLIRWGTVTPEVLARFESERQALALMDHPAIAKLFEAGATPDRRPYFALEYVDGTPITEHCDRHRLSIAERLRLFQRVCDGVQHAHHKAVIHRDLKPSNVLIANEPGAAAPKIIDFGVAKAIAGRLTDGALRTQAGVLIGTPEYMSPEQIDLGPHDVDTRADIYSLGVMLYELLTGTLPFGSKELRDSGFDETRRRIREVEPPRPSARVAALGAAAAAAARARRTQPGVLARQLRGDLDWITMKALAKDRTRRYGSPAELAADLARHLRHEPVLAGPPSAGYQVRKYVRRHRFGVFVSAVLVLVFVLFAGAMALQSGRVAAERNRANREAEAARHASAFLQRIFDIPNPARGQSVTARELLDSAATEVDAGRGSEAELGTQQRVILATAYASLGLHAQAEEQFQEAQRIRSELLGNDHPETLAVRHGLGKLRARQGRLDEAEILLRDVLERRARVLGPDDAATIESLDSLAVLREAQGDLHEAARLTEQVLDRKRRRSGREDPDTLRTMANLSTVYQTANRLPEAEALARETLTILQRVVGPQHPDTLRVLNNLGVILEEEREYDEAQRLYEGAVEELRRVLGREHPDTLKAEANLAIVHLYQGRYAEAEALDRDLAGRFERALGPEHSDTLWVQRNLALARGKQGAYEEAAGLLQQALETARAARGPDDADAAAAFYDMGVLALLRGRRSEALDRLRDAVEHGYDAALFPEDPDLEALHGDAGFEALVNPSR